MSTDKENLDTFESYKSEIIIVILIFVSLLYVYDEIAEPHYSMCDVHKYCAANPEVYITLHGDNCTWVMDSYNENENFTRWRIDK